MFICVEIKILNQKINNGMNIAIHLFVSFKFLVIVDSFDSDSKWLFKS